MGILPFPPEIFHIILVDAVLGRGVKRGLRLRLVCKAFACMVHTALLETCLMDDFGSTATFGSTKWRLRHQHGAFELWNQYLVMRSLREQNPAVGRFVEIRDLAKAIHSETVLVLDLKGIVETLCQLASTHRIQKDCEDLDRWGPLLAAWKKPKADLGLNMLTAASHLNLLPLAKRLLDQGGHSPTSHNYLFAPPIQVAAQAGNLEMLQLLQGYLPDSEFECLSVRGAAMRGDIHILKTALRIGECDDSDGSVLIYGQQYGSIDHTTDIGEGILLARGCAVNAEVYEYLTGALRSWPKEFDHRDLTINVGLGNMAMVRYLLESGVAVQQHLVFKDHYLAPPLAMAARHMHNDAAKLLLDHGADPNYVSNEKFPLLPLHEPATSSNLSLARTLLHSGALINGPVYGLPRWPALYWAFTREHENMVRLLLEHGADFCSLPEPPMNGGDVPQYNNEDWTGNDLVEMTYFLGWTSMAELLREHGFKGTRPCPLPRRRHIKHWTHWEDARAVSSQMQNRRRIGEAGILSCNQLRQLPPSHGLPLFWITPLMTYLYKYI